LEENCNNTVEKSGHVSGYVSRGATLALGLSPTSSKEECAYTVRSLMLCLVGMLNDQRFITKFV